MTVSQELPRPPAAVLGIRTAALGLGIYVLMAAAPAAGETLTLQRAVAIAMEQSPTAQLAEHRVEQAAARTDHAWAGFFPTLSLYSSYSVTDNPVMVFSSALNQGKFSPAMDVNDPPTADNWQLSLLARYRLFAGGRDMAGLNAARSAERGMSMMKEADMDHLALQVTRSYLAVLTAKEFVRAAEAAVTDLRSSEQVMASRVAAGTALRTGQLEIQVQLAQSEARLLAASNTLALARESLRFAMGLDSLPYQEFGVLDDLNLPEPSADTVRERPEVLARAALADAARAEQRAASAGYLPSINAFAGADRFQGSEFNGTGKSWMAGLSLEWQIFDGLSTRAQVREKQRAVSMAEEEERAARLQSSLALKTAALNLEDATRRVEVMERAVALAGEHRELARQRFEQGLLLPSEIVDTENALVQAEVGLAQAKADRQYAIASLRSALGLPILGDTPR